MFDFKWKEAFDRGLRANRHEDGRLHRAVRGVERTCTRKAGAPFYSKINRIFIIGSALTLCGNTVGHEISGKHNNGSNNLKSPDPSECLFCDV